MTDPSFYAVARNGLAADVVFALFLTLVVGVTLVKIWLARRQIRYVRAHRGAVPDAFADQIVLSDHQKAADYAVARAKFSIVNAVVSALFLLWLTLGGGMDWLVEVWAKLHESTRFFQTIVLFCSIFLISSLISAMLDYCRVFRLEARFGFNRMGRRLWGLDQVRSALLALAFELPLVLIAVWLMNAATTTWWIWLWAVLIAFNLLMAAIYPKVIAPMFNRFTPLKDPSLSERVDALLKANRFKVGGLFVMDGSKRSSHGNAYFTGFGATKRIVFFDTLLETLSIDEMVAVLAHELGHLKKHHIWKSLIGFAFLAFAFLYGLYLLANFPPFFAGLHVHATTTPVKLLLFMQIIPFLTFLLSPLFSGLSRRHEYEADQFAATQASANDLASALVKLYKDNASTLTPDPVYSAVYDSHPTAACRIARLRQPPD